MSSSARQFDHLRIPLDDIKLATNNFAETNVIGRGGFGKVYEGELTHCGEKNKVAVKRLDTKLGQGDPQFWQEISVLSRYKHTNLVFLLGFSDDGVEKTLVYEYLPKKSLDKHLISPDLSWIERLNICIGAAQGIEYLHNPSSSKGRSHEIVLHRDIKSANILLDSNWDAKVSDFGLSVTGVASNIMSISQQVVGTLGYCDPVFSKTGIYYKESDIYSFGVVLFEVFSGRLACVNYNDGRLPTPQLARQCYDIKIISTVVLDCLKEQISPCCLSKFSKIAYKCLGEDHEKRPSMSVILNELKAIRLHQIGSDILKKRKLRSHSLFQLIEKTQRRRHLWKKNGSDIKKKFKCLFHEENDVCMPNST